jgi:diguanylate cyclase (GGDEF)-like protein
MKLLSNFLRKINNYFTKNKPTVAMTWGGVLLILIACIDYQVPSEISLAIFYLLPISLMTWFVSKEAGLVTCVLSAIAELITNLNTKNTESNFFVPYWEAVVNLIIFLTISYLLFELHSTLAQEKKLERIDYTTGVANKRLFLELARLELKKAYRYRHPLTVVYLDVDNFKKINEALGYRVGDKLLKTAAVTIKNNLRETDFLGRVGGDEFVILLPGSGYEPSHLVISRIQKQLLAAMKKNKWQATFSIGAVTYVNPPRSVDAMLQQADHLMYLVKNNGKNQLKHKTSVGN